MISAGETRAGVASHEGALEQVRPSGLSSLTVTGWARDSASKTPVQVQILVDDVVRATVTANRPRLDGRNGFEAQVHAPAQPALVCARTVASPPRAGFRLGCKIPAFGVPVRIVGAPGKPPPSGQLASFFWVDSRGEIAKDLDTVPIVDGVASFTGEPRPRAVSWAIAVHEPSGGRLFRSGPLDRLPGPASIAITPRIAIFRSSTPVSFDPRTDEGGIEFLRARLRRLPSPLRFDSVSVAADSAGHELVTVRGRVRQFILLRPFAYTLPVRVRPATAPGHPADVVVAEHGGPASTTGANVSSHATVLDKAIFEGVKSALDAAIKRIAKLEVERLHVDVPPSVVSVSTIEVRATSVSVRLHAGAIVDPGDIVIDD